MTGLESLRRSQTPWSEIAASAAAASRKLIVNAPDDGQAMLNFLSPELLSIGSPVGDLADKAYAWTKSEFARFQSEGDEKHSGYYDRLRKFFNAQGYVS